MKHIFIINPAAGKNNQLEEMTKEIEKVFEQGTYLIEVTKSKGDATIIAERFAKTKEVICFYACGGDGTINEVVNGIYKYPNARLAILPIGTGNDFVKSFPSISRKQFLSIASYKEAKTIQCDVMVAAGKAAINTASAGLDAAVAVNVDKFKKLPLLKGSTPYYLGLLNSMLTSLTTRMKIVVDGEVISGDEYTFAVACNGKYYGGGYCPCPDSVMNDGLMDLCLIRKVSRTQILRLSGKYKKGTHVSYEDLVVMKRCKTVQIISDEKVALNLDGEVLYVTNPHIRILPNCITLHLPQDAITNEEKLA